MNSNEPHRLRLVALQGSVRPGNYTAKALAVIEDEIAGQPGVDLEIIDPSDLQLPLPGQGASDDARRIRETVAAADGVILATPEYHGSFSSVMKLIIDNLGFPSVIAGKPVALLGVAGGQIGAIKALEHLRSVASHVGAVVLPGPVSIAKVRTAFDAEGRMTNERAEARVRGLATSLTDYIQKAVCPRMALERMAREELAV